MPLIPNNAKAYPSNAMAYPPQQYFAHGQAENMHSFPHSVGMNPSPIYAPFSPGQTSGAPSPMQGNVASLAPTYNVPPGMQAVFVPGPHGQQQLAFVPIQAQPMTHEVSHHQTTEPTPDGTVSIMLVPKSQWMPNHDRDNCPFCSTTFTMMFRRHHCRTCGFLVCQRCSERRHPLLPDERICRRCYSYVIAKASGLQDCSWYHGKLTRWLAEFRLRSVHSQPGDFLVRESESQDGFVVVSSANRNYQNGVRHVLVYGSAGNWAVAANASFSTIQELIETMRSQRKLRRPALVLDESGVPVSAGPSECPMCKKALDPTTEALFCFGCGTRIRSTRQEMDLYEANAESAEEPELTALPTTPLPASMRPLTMNGHHAETVSSAAVSESSTLVQLQPVPSTVSANMDWLETKSLGGNGSDDDARWTRTSETAPGSLGETETSPEKAAPLSSYAFPPEQRQAHKAQPFVHQNWAQDARINLLRPLLLSIESSGRLKLHEELGSGRLGQVKRGTHDGSTVAVKMSRSMDLNDGLLHECIALTTLSHPRIVKVLGLLMDTPIPAMLLEYLDGGSLERFLHKKGTKMPLNQRAVFSYQIAEAVTYLQGRKIAHGDLAARNVLVDSRRGCVLADFDLARWPGSVEQKCADQVPVRWAANELFHKKTPPTMASDIYSLGITIWEVYSNATLPFGRYSQEQVKSLKKAGTLELKFLEKTPTSIWNNVIVPCTTSLPEDRPTAAHVLNILEHLLP